MAHLVNTQSIYPTAAAGAPDNVRANAGDMTGLSGRTPALAGRHEH